MVSLLNVWAGQEDAQKAAQVRQPMTMVMQIQQFFQKLLHLRFVFCEFILAAEINIACFGFASTFALS